MTDRATVYRFGEFTFNAVSGDLWREGEDTTRLQPQPLQVLLLLLCEPGRVVSRHELRSTLWPQDTYIEFDDGLNHAIRRLREALGDTAKAPRFIETVPRRGYRFIASVQTQLLSEVPGDHGAAHRSPEHRFDRRVLVGMALISLVFLALSGFIIHILYRSAPRVHSLAVLPLTNFSDDPTQEHFADGITEELTTELSRTTSARIISRTSSMRLKKTKLSLQEIGRELGVDAVIEGSVQRSGDRVRISAQLIQLPTERHLWAQSYERDLKDILVVRSEVSREIAAQVLKRLAMPDRQGADNISPGL